MKKCISLILTVLMICSISVCAFSKTCDRGDCASKSNCVQSVNDCSGLDGSMCLESCFKSCLSKIKSLFNSIFNKDCENNECDSNVCIGDLENCKEEVCEQNANDSSSCDSKACEDSVLCMENKNNCNSCESSVQSPSCNSGSNDCDVKQSEDSQVPQEDQDKVDNSNDNTNYPQVSQNDNVDTSLTSLANEVVRLVNEERTSRGLNALSVNVSVQSAAQTRAEEIKNFFSHTRPNGTKCFTALNENGVSYRGAGENIAMGQKTAEQVMSGWMNSSGHRANILNSRYTQIGVGVYKDSNGRYCWTQMFIY